MSQGKFQAEKRKAAILSNSRRKPPMPVIVVNAIPDELKQLCRWVGWRWKLNAKTKKWDKLPINVRTERLASCTDPSMWCSFQEALAAKQKRRVDGISFALGEVDGTTLVGIDLDDCRDPATEELSDLAHEIISAMKTYAEVSPTGTGIKLLCEGRLPDGARHKNKASTVEVYDSGRFFTITGQRVGGTPKRVEKRKEQLLNFYENYFGRQRAAVTTTSSVSSNGHATEAAVKAMLGIRPVREENDGSLRLIHAVREAVKCGLDNDATIAAIRAYEKVHPLPKSYSDDEILRRLQDVRDRAKDSASDTNDAQAPLDPEELLADMPQSVRDEACAMLESPNLLERINDDVAALGVAGERQLVLSIYLVGVSRILSQPLAAIVQATSSTGKSFVVDKTGALFPPEEVIRATMMTPQSLFYMPRGSLSHRFVIAGERSRRNDDETADATRPLREMLSSGCLTKLTTGKASDGNNATQVIDQPGPIAYIETTSVKKVFEEDANRCLPLTTDESEEHTRAVLKRYAARCAGAAVPNDQATIEKHHALQRMLRPLTINIPFADRLAELFEAGPVVARCAFPHLLGMIQATTLLHQYQRKRDTDARLIATADDYRIARELCRGPLARLFGKVTSKAAIDFHSRLKAQFKSDFSTSDAGRKETKFNVRSVQGWLNELLKAGAVKQVKPKRGNQPAIWKLTNMDRSEVTIGGFQLPKVEQVCT